MAYKKRIAGITIELDADTSALVKKLDGVSTKIGKIGDSITRTGENLTKNVTVPIAAGFGTAIKTAADFDAQMSKVQAISGANANEFDQLKTKAREMGEATKFSATESGEAFEYMAMAGWKTDDMLNGIAGIMNLAAASGEELGTTSDIVTDALTAFGMSAQDSGRFADILAAAATNANTNVSMMGESFKYVAPVAGALGYKAEDVAVALGLMANSGIKADMAGTSLRNMFNRMAKPTDESRMAMIQLGLSLTDAEGNAYSFRDMMDQIRESFGGVTVNLDEYNKALDSLDAQLEAGEIDQKAYDDMLNTINVDLLGNEGAEKARYAAMLGGTRAMSGLLAIANASEEEYNNLTKAIDNSSDAFALLEDGSVVPLNEALESGQKIVEQYNGQAEAMANVMQNNLSGDLTKLLSQLQELAISFGELLMPLLRELVGMLRGVVDWLNSLSDEQKEHIMKIAAVVAAVGPVLIIIGKVITGISSVISVISGIITVAQVLIPIIASISWPVLAVVAAIAAVIAIGVALYKNWDKICEWAGKLKEKVSEAWNGLKEKASETWGNIKDTVSQKWDEMKDKISNSAIGQAAGKVWDAMKETVSDKMAAVKQAYEEHGGGLEGIMAGAMEGIKGYFTLGWDFLDNLTGGKLTEIKDMLSEKMSGIKDNISEKWTNIKDKTSEVWGNIKDKINENGGGITGVLKTATQGYFNIWKSAFNKIDDKTGGVMSGLLGKIREKGTQIKDAIVEKLTAAVDWIKELPDKALTWGADIIQGLIDGIKSKISDLTDGAAEIAQTIKEFIHFSEPDKGPLSDFSTYMPDMIQSMAKGIEQNLHVIQNMLNKMTMEMSKIITGMDMNKMGSEMSNGLMSGLQSGLSGVQRAANSVGLAIRNAFSGMNQDAANWGADLMSNLIAGISSQLNNLVYVVRDVAGTISSYLHFSEPDKGPLSNFHTFMPDMIKEITSGIYQGIPKVESAMNSLASTMVPQATTNNNMVTLNIQGAAGQDVNALADIIQDRLNQAIFIQEAVYA